MSIIIVGCSRRKVDSISPLPALDIYQGGCVPLVRSRVQDSPERRSRVFILSAKYGLLGANDLITAYDQFLTIDRAKELRPSVQADVISRIIYPFRPSEILVIADPLYLVLIADILSMQTRPIVYWEPDPSNAQTLLDTILDSWGWVL